MASSPAQSRQSPANSPFSTIVGYNSNELREGAVGAGATFMPITGSSIDISALSVTGYDPEEGTFGDVYIQVLDNSGCSNQEETYYWCDGTLELDEENVTYKGWYYLDDDGIPYDIGHAVTFLPGDGLWMNAPGDSWKLQSNGQVSEEDIPTTLREGAKMVANATSADVKLNGGTKAEWNGVYVTGYEAADGTFGDVYIQILDNSGCSNDTETYYWCEGELELDEETVSYYGWYYLDDDGIPYEIGSDVTIKAGEAVWVNSPNDSMIINFPTAL